MNTTYTDIRCGLNAKDTDIDKKRPLDVHTEQKQISRIFLCDNYHRSVDDNFLMTVIVCKTTNLFNAVRNENEVNLIELTCIQVSEGCHL